MRQTIESTVGEAPERLRRLGLPETERVTIVVGKPTLAGIAAKMRETARRQGMTAEIFEQIMRDE